MKKKYKLEVDYHALLVALSFGTLGSLALWSSISAINNSLTENNAFVLMIVFMAGFAMCGIALFALLRLTFSLTADNYRKTKAKKSIKKI